MEKMVEKCWFHPEEWWENGWTCMKMVVSSWRMRVLPSNMEVVQPRKSRCVHQNWGSPANMKLAAHVLKLWSWGTFFNNNNHINKPWGGLQYTIWGPAESMAINVEELSCSKLVIFHCDVSYPECIHGVYTVHVRMECEEIRSQRLAWLAFHLHRLWIRPTQC